MKRLFIACAVAFLTAGSFATTIASDANNRVVVQDEKEKINADQLPETVKTTLSGEEYKDWTVSAAYHLKSSDQYEVELSKDGETKTVKLDKDGKVIS